MSNDFLDFIFASMVGIASYFFGGLDGLMQVLIILTIIDYISGICVAGFEHKLSSSKGFKGIVRKVFMISLVGISNLIDKHFLGNAPTLRPAVCLFFISNEGVSIFENAYALDIPLPQILIDKFAAFKEDKHTKITLWDDGGYMIIRDYFGD